MQIHYNDANKVVAEELTKALQDIIDAKSCIYEDEDANRGLNRAQGRIETIINLLK